MNPTRWLPGLCVPAFAGLLLLAPRPALACSGIPPCFDFALPKTGTTGVPLNSGVVISRLGGSADVQLEKDGTAVWTAGAPARFPWDVDGCLASYALPALDAQTSYAVTSAGTELTRFTTSDKAEASPGTPATIQSLTVKVVEYPPEEQAQAACIGCSTADIAGVTFAPAVFPDTPASSVLYTWSLYLEGGQEGPAPGPLRFQTGATSLGCRGPYPCWLSPCSSRTVGSRYCARVWAWGIPYAPDKALVSDEVCTSVVREVRPGRAGPDAGAGGADAAADGGVRPGADTGATLVADAAHDGGAPPGADAASDAGEGTGGAGCSTVPGGAAGFGLFVLGAALRRRPASAT